MITIYTIALSFFGNQNGIFNLIPPNPSLPFPGFMGWKQHKKTMPNSNTKQS